MNARLPYLRLASLSLFLILLFPSLSLSAFGNTMKEKNVLELTYSSRNMILKFRPADFTLPGETYRIDLLVGRNFSTWTAYIYMKGDNHHGRWLGARLDAPLPLAFPSFKAKLQLRYFQGLNPSSVDHYYVIPTMYYSLGRKRPVQAGLIGFGKKNLGGNATFYLGPAVAVPITHSLKARLSYGENLLGKGALLYLKVDIGFH